MIYRLICVVLMLVTAGCMSEPIPEQIQQVVQTSEEEPARKTFDELFKLEKTVVIKGTEENMLLKPGRIALSNDFIVVPDQHGHNVATYTWAGELINAWGREGKGPGEFVEPDWAGVDSKGNIYIREVQGAFRMQKFDNKGRYLDAFPLLSFGGFTDSYVDEESGLFYTVSRVPCKEAGKGSCAIQGQDIEGEIINAIGPVSEVSPGKKGLPYYASFHKKNTFYVGHVHGTSYSVYDANGQRIKEVATDESQHVKMRDSKRVPQDVYKRYEWSKKQANTIMVGLKGLSDYLIVAYLRSPKLQEKTGESRYFMNFYNNNDELVLDGVNVDTHPSQVWQNHLVFVHDKADLDNGGIEVKLYTLRREIKN